MSHLTIPAIIATFVASSIAASYEDQDDRVLDQIERPRGHRAATLAEVMARPLGPIPSPCRLRMAA